MANKLEITVALKLKTCSNSPSKIEKINSNTICLYGINYQFNHIFNQAECPYQIYESLMEAYMENLMNGLDSLIMVYGPESIGKAETLGSIFFSSKKFNERGIIPNFLIDLFTRIEEEKSIDNKLDYSVQIDITEIHDGKTSSLFNCAKNCFIKVNSLCNAIELIEHKTPQHLNSHLIFRLKMEKYLLKKKIFDSEINFVDLAGWKDELSNSTKFLKVKWDLMLLEEFLRAKLYKKRPHQSNELCVLFNEMLTRNPKTLLLVCLDPAHPCINSVTFGSHFYQERQKLSNKLINCNKKGSCSNDETIEWGENDGENVVLETEKARAEVEKNQNFSSNYRINITSAKTPLTLIRPKNICDSPELYFRGKENEFKQPELAHVKLCFSDNTIELDETKKSSKKRKINAEQENELYKCMLQSLFEDFLEIIEKYKVKFQLF